VGVSHLDWGVPRALVWVLDLILVLADNIILDRVHDVAALGEVMLLVLGLGPHQDFEIRQILRILV